jgi:hypothetical protein
MLGYCPTLRVWLVRRLSVEVMLVSKDAPSWLWVR